MFSNRLILTQRLACGLSALIALSGSVARAADQESADRVVDQASVEMQDEADRDLAAMVAQYRGTPRESEMLLRLAELRMEIAESLFRVAYGPGEIGLKAAYQAKLTSSIAPLSRILDAYPKSEGAPRALFLRGKAEKELGKDAAALKDFEAFLAKYPSRDEAPLAAIGVADLSMAKEKYARVISVLKVVLAKPEHPLYPNALAKRAWALQADGHSAEAIADLRTLAKFFQIRESSKSLSAGDRALRESILSDVPTIAYLAYRSHMKGFALQDLNDLLRSFDSGEGYRRMSIKIADALRAADQNADLRTWKSLVLKSDPSKKENFPMLVTVLEYDLDRESFADVVKTADDIADILAKNPEIDDAETARRLVVKAIDQLTKRLTDYKKTEKANEAEKFLAVLLPTFDRMTTEADARRIVLRWNIAETYFSLDRYESATANYRWIYSNWSPAAEVSLAKATTRSGAALKAISSRYETLRAMKLIPEDLEAKAAIANPVRDAAKIALVREWMGWVDAYAREGGAPADVAHYHFEAYRTLYQAGFQDEAMDDFSKFALSQPTSKFAVPSASLVIDTWIARKRWDKVEDESRAFATTFAASNKTFSGKMATQAASAKFKRAESAYASKNYGDTVKQAKEFVASYGNSNMASDAAGMVCNSYLASNEQSEAVECFSNFAKTYSGSPAAKQALRTAARLEDESFHYAAAADLYSRYLAASKSGLSASENLTIRKRILLLSRATGDADRMTKVSTNRALCAPKLDSVCNLNLAMVALMKGSSSVKATEWALRQAKSAPKGLRSIYAMIAIGGLSSNDQWKTMDSSSIDRATKALAANWKFTEPAVRYFLIARATKAFPTILERDLKTVKRLAIDASEKAITRRMRALKSFEARSAEVSEVPVNAIRVIAARTLFQAYVDLIDDMREIPAPAKATAGQLAEHRNLIAALSNPFVMKSRKIRDSAMALELREKSGLDSDSVDAIWSKPGVATASGEMLRKEWAKAVSDENWTRVAFLSDESSDLKGIPSGWSKAARAASLAEAGAASEAKAVFGDACRDSSGAPTVREACRVVAKKGRG